jgi:D-alanyl-lipoteichoic acid acyltransferase DltB (MBOAT superfamily)
MLFNSIAFAVFLPVVFMLYWGLAGKNLRWQNLLLLAASYFFYGCWDYRFMFLLLFSTGLDYFTGLQIERSATAPARKAWLVISVVINLGLLGFFKYYNFFVENFIGLLHAFGYRGSTWLLHIILPLGISFYTFHGLSYVFDIYRNKIKPTHNFIDYAVFVSFFPLLVAGPIERAGHLLPQVQKPRVFNRAQATDGLRQLLWGLFKKMVIADSFAQYVDNVYDSPGLFAGSDMLMVIVFFSFQIYADFSGYSDIAIGTGRLLGFDLLRNFSYPYFSRDIAEFWRRWHISLTTWFRDYLYIPLGGSMGGKAKTIRNIMIVFLVSGFWHGASWTFICWGGINALLFLPLLYGNRNRQHLDIVARGRRLPSLRDAFNIACTFALTSLAWVFFRAESLGKAFDIIAHLFSRSLFYRPRLFPVISIVVLVLFVGIEWMGREQPYAIARLGWQWPRPVRWAFYYMLIIAMFYIAPKTQQFIYFQF